MSTAPQPPQRRRIPTAAFVLGYGILVILAIILIITLVNHEASSKTTRAPKEEEAAPAPEFPADAKATLGLVNTALIDDPAAVSTDSGLLLEGVLTETAVANPQTLALHIDQLLNSTCLTNLALETPNNMQLDFWGFCFSSLPPEHIAEMITDAIETDADSLAIRDWPGSNHDKHVFYTWFADTPAEQAAIENKWTAITGHKDIELVSLNLYGPESVQVVDFENGGKPQREESPANEAFDRRWNK